MVHNPERSVLFEQSLLAGVHSAIGVAGRLNHILLRRANNAELRIVCRCRGELLLSLYEMLPLLHEPLLLLHELLLLLRELLLCVRELVAG
jgi:hypothetical protein